MACLKIRTVVSTSTGVPAEVLFIMTNVPPELNTHNQHLMSTHATFPANSSAMSKSQLILMSVVLCCVVLCCVVLCCVVLCCVVLCCVVLCCVRTDSLLD